MQAEAKLKLIEDSAFKRYGQRFLYRESAFIMYRIVGNVMWVDEMFSTNYMDLMSLLIESRDIARTNGCLEIWGVAEPTNPYYPVVRKLYKYFDMHFIRFNEDGGEVWGYAT